MEEQKNDLEKKVDSVINTGPAPQENKEETNEIKTDSSFQNSVTRENVSPEPNSDAISKTPETTGLGNGDPIQIINPVLSPEKNVQTPEEINSEVAQTPPLQNQVGSTETTSSPSAPLPGQQPVQNVSLGGEEKIGASPLSPPIIPTSGPSFDSRSPFGGIIDPGTNTQPASTLNNVQKEPIIETHRKSKLLPILLILLILIIGLAAGAYFFQNELMTFLGISAPESVSNNNSVPAPPSYSANINENSLPAVSDLNENVNSPENQNENVSGVIAPMNDNLNSVEQSVNSNANPLPNQNSNGENSNLNESPSVPEVPVVNQNVNGS